MPIPFTQYILPNGEKKRIEIARPGDIEAMAQEIRASGYVFECEVLSTNKVSLTVTDTREDGAGDIAIRICADDRAVPVAVDELVKDAYRKTCDTTENLRRRRRHMK